MQYNVYRLISKEIKGQQKIGYFECIIYTA